MRLTLAFAVVMALVFAGMGAFVYVRVSDALVASVDQTLRSHVQEAEHHARERETVGQRDTDDDGVTLVRLRPPGSVPAGLHTTDLAGHDGEWRLLAQPVRIAGKPYTLTLARSLHSREETLHHLFRGFLIAGPLALLLAALAGYGLAAAALRPVEAMRARAQAISAETPGRRLPVPRGRDEVRRLAETLNQMLARLEASFAHERRFVADASHELRTPLALLRTELEVALRRRRSVDELEAALRSAAAETERLSRLAEDLLLIARADQGMLPIRSEPLVAGQLLEHVASRFESETRGRGRALRVDADGAIRLAGDALRLEQAVANLLGNALTHGRGTVTLAARPAGGLVALHVLDEGPGFPEEFIGRAFDRFSRADEARGAGGTGLGLSIVALIAEAHGGTVGAANRPEGGADVWIAVPAAAPERGTTPRDRAARVPSA